MYGEVSFSVQIWQIAIVHRLGDANASVEAIHISSHTQESFNLKSEVKNSGSPGE